MNPGSVLPVVAIQLAALLAPLAAGLAGWVSGPVAGFASVALWFAAGLPLSYTFVDRRRLSRLRAQSRPPVPAAVDALSRVSQA